MKICILGAGALGCAIGAALSEAGHETWLLNRGHAHVEAMNLYGLRVQDERGERQVRVKAACDAATVGVADLVVVLVKSFHTGEAIAGAKARISATGEREAASDEDEGIVTRVAPRPRPRRGARLQRGGRINHSSRETFSQQGINVGAATYVLMDGQMRQYQFEIRAAPSPRIRDDKES